MLTPHQEDKAGDILGLLFTQRFVVLEGSAGVGKTWLANYIIKQFHSQRKGIVYVSAPTNKAVAVIRGKVDELPEMVFLTTHSALRMKKTINNKTGKVTFKSYSNPRYPVLDKVKLLVIDEGSMLNTEMLDYVIKHATEQNVKVLFIGDNKQLNPVGEETSPIFDREFPTVSLTEIIRQGEGNPIIELSRNIPLIWTKQDNRLEIGGYMHSSDQQKVIDTLATVNGTDELKYLAWTNKDVDNTNVLVRRRIYGVPARIQEGESLIFDEPFINNAGEILFYTNEEITVESLDIRPIDVFYPIKSNMRTGEREDKRVTLQVYRINADKPELPDGVPVVHEDSDEIMKKMIAEMIRNCYARTLEWVDYYAFLGKFAKVKYNHAITVHKSQGSTYEQTIINVRNLNLNKRAAEKQRLFYTAVTRASRLLVLYNT